MNFFKSLFLFFSIIVFCLYSYSQNKNSWTTSPFEDKEFVENNGQFNKQISSDNPVLFVICQGAYKVYFTRNEVIYRHLSFIAKPEEQSKKKKRKEESEEEERKIETKETILTMQFQNSDESAQVLGLDTVSYYRTYPNIEDPSYKSTIKASCYKKIIYKNIYPNIDIEYFFLNDTTGIKYNVILRPGADVNQVKMKYRGSKNLSIDTNGSMQIDIGVDLITDHAPVSCSKNGEKIKTKFILTKNIVSFQLESANTSDTIIIDPWTTSPGFVICNRAYDVEFDNYGNAYAYGGEINSFEVAKFSATGAILWKYTNIDFQFYYGDFTIDRVSGSVYLVEGFNASASRVIKLNQAGNQIGISVGDPLFNEMWRANYNSCTKKIVIAGGGTTGTNQACILDTTLAITSPINILSTAEQYHDIALLGQDNYGECFFVSAKTSISANFDNVLISCPASTLIPVNYMVPSNHAFQEVSSVAYIGNTGFAGNTNGFNGLAASQKYVYTYDGADLRKWNKLTGALITTKNITNTPFRWGGLASDECDNLFVGDKKSIHIYDSTLVLVNTINVADTIYDVMLAPNNLLYASGLGFVSQLQVNGIVCNTDLDLSLDIDTCASSADVIITGGLGPYQYLWSPNGETTAGISNLSAGSYTVTIKDATCVPKVVNKTFAFQNIEPGLKLEVDSCENKASININCGEPPYQYLWSNGNTSASIDNIVNGFYSVTITDAAIPIPNIIVQSFNFESEICDYSVYAPNCFTPDENGLNDGWKPLINGIVESSYELYIYNRWGDLIWTTKNSTEFWDGRVKGRMVPLDVYVWKLRFVDSVYQAKHDVVGHLSVLR